MNRTSSICEFFFSCGFIKLRVLSSSNRVKNQTIKFNDSSTKIDLVLVVTVNLQTCIGVTSWITLMWNICVLSNLIIHWNVLCRVAVNSFPLVLLVHHILHTKWIRTCIDTNFESKLLSFRRYLMAETKATCIDEKHPYYSERRN